MGRSPRDWVRGSAKVVEGNDGLTNTTTPRGGSLQGRIESNCWARRICILHPWSHYSLAFFCGSEPIFNPIGLSRTSTSPLLPRASHLNLPDETESSNAVDEAEMGIVNSVNGAVALRSRPVSGVVHKLQTCPENGLGDLQRPSVTPVYSRAVNCNR